MAWHNRGSLRLPGDCERVKMQYDDHTRSAFRIVRVRGAIHSDLGPEPLTKPALQFSAPILRGVCFLQYQDVVTLPQPARGLEKVLFLVIRIRMKKAPEFQESARSG